jgi:hypothetical protein
MDAHIEVAIDDTGFMCWKGAHRRRIENIPLEIERSSMTRTPNAIRLQVHLEWTPSVRTGEIKHAHVVASPGDQHTGAANRKLLAGTVGNDTIEWTKIVGMTRCVTCGRKESSKCLSTCPRCQQRTNADKHRASGCSRYFC